MQRSIQKWTLNEYLADLIQEKDLMKIKYTAMKIQKKKTQTNITNPHLKIKYQLNIWLDFKTGPTLW